MNYIIAHESSYDPTEIGDMDLTCRRTGAKMMSVGLVQINNCYWPDITFEQASSINFSIEFLAKNLAIGHCRYWSTCPDKLQNTSLAVLTNI